MPNVATPWQEKLETRLISAGVRGVQQQLLVSYLARQATGEEIENYLNALWSEQKVQRFTRPPGPRGGRSSRIWRATQKLIED